MRKTLNLCILLLLSLVLITGTLWAGNDKLYPLTPKKVSNYDRNVLQPPYGFDQTDAIYAYQHVDENAEYYLGSGAADDTFFIVFEPPVACSVKYVEMQWFDAGNVTGFAAWYSAAAMDTFPDGTAPNRGTSPVSPIDSIWIAGPVPNEATGTGNWEPFDLGGAEFIVGDSATLASGMFGVGFIKSAATPHPLADGMNAKGIRFTYTWFGGPWMALMEHDWGAYSGNIQTGTVIDVMMRVWVSYPWGMPVLINNLLQMNNTFDIAGPYTITCELEDDGIGVNEEDTILLKYTIGDTMEVEMEETSPGSGVYGADIPGQPVGSQIVYWVYTMDDEGLENESLPKAFSILEPTNDDADILFVTDGISDRLSAYTNFFNENYIYYEHWDVTENMGIDNSVINGYDWGTILLVGWGVSVLPAEGLDTPFADFLDAGGNLFYTDQDYFYGNNLPETGTFVTGDFAYDYLGIGVYWNDPAIGDSCTSDWIYYGVAGDPISGTWADDFYETYWDTLGVHMEPGQFWADYITVSTGTDIFYGASDGNTYGCTNEDVFKTVYLGFMAEASCEYDTVNYEWIPSADFEQLLLDVFTWFGTSDVDKIGSSTAPVNYSLSQNYPNPFNPSTTINFTVKSAGKVQLDVYNLTGEKVVSLINGPMNSGAHMINFDASELSSGIYFYKLTAGNFSDTKKMILIK
ncbi:T9SS type A sorting domain-containing protein [bacterium]|nr:T9SS type A sorting domain-containing protein [bacterium]